MKAVSYSRYGPPSVLSYGDVDPPTPADDEVLIAVRAASVNPLDWHFMRGTPYVARVAFGLRRPRLGRLGADVAGRIAAIGKNVTQLAPGDDVFGSCRGAFAERACAPQSAVAAMPAHLTFEQAAAVPVAALTALQALRDKGRLQPGQTVLINGASGGVGTFAVQIAKALGAEVTGVCSTRNVELVQSIGADHVVDYNREDFAASGCRYDVLLDCVGNRSVSSCRRVLNANGAYVVVGGPDGRWVGPLPLVLKALLLSPLVSQRLVTMMAKPNRDDLLRLSTLIEAGQVRPVIDRSFPLSETADAVAYLETGHARGKVVVTVDRTAE
jgi:NADPH:quinone reductase-like Zn-dependent oxidoreductase